MAKDYLNKSSRSKADLFEALIAEFLADYYGVKKDFSKSINQLKRDIKTKFKDSDFRIEEQKKKVKTTSQEIITFLRKKRIKDIKDVDWIGRYHKEKQTLSDVDLILKNKKEIIGISLKSTRLGLGTQKNIGYRTLKKYLSLNIDNDLDLMWKRLRSELKEKGSNLKVLSSAFKTVIKNEKRRYSIVEKLGKKYGYPVQVKSVRKSIRNFNKLSDNNKSKFMKLLFGLEKDKRRILNVIAQGNKISIYWNEIFNSIVSGRQLRARKIKDVSYGIYLEGKLIIRLQANFTNGIGISPYCQRGFLPKDN